MQTPPSAPTAVPYNFVDPSSQTIALNDDIHSTSGRSVIILNASSSTGYQVSCSCCALHADGKAFFCVKCADTADNLRITPMVANLVAACLGAQLHATAASAACSTQHRSALVVCVCAKACMLWTIAGTPSSLRQTAAAGTQPAMHWPACRQCCRSSLLLHLHKQPADSCSTPTRQRQINSMRTQQAVITRR